MTTRVLEKINGLPDYLYDLLSGKNVVDMDYQGSETTHVRRVIVLIADTPTAYTGYEIGRDGVWRTMDDAPVKSYRKDRIYRDDRRVVRGSELPAEFVQVEGL